MKIVFLDTNIILDLLQRRDEYISAAKIFQGAIDGKYVIITSTISMVNMAYILRKKFKGDDLYNLLERLNGLLQVVGVSDDAYRKSIQAKGDDFEDTIQLYSAKEAGASCVVTRNIKDFTEGVLPIYEPNDFLNL